MATIETLIKFSERARVNEDIVTAICADAATNTITMSLVEKHNNASSYDEMTQIVEDILFYIEWRKTRSIELLLSDF